MGKSDSESWLIAGLGNPGPEYAKTRHNCGFRALDLLAQSLDCKVDKLKFQGLYGQTSYHGKKLFLLKPQTFMNLSGRSVLQLSAYFHIPPQRIIVLCGGKVVADGTRDEIFGNQEILDTVGIRPPEIFSMARALDKKAYCYTIDEFVKGFGGK